MPLGLVNVILFSVTTEGTEFEVLFRNISFLIPFQVFFKSLIFVWKQFVKYDCLLLFRKVDKRLLYCLYLKWASFFKSVSFSFMNLDSNLSFTELDFCMPDVIQGLLLNFSLCLDTFFNWTYLSGIKMILLRKLWKERFTLACFILIILFQSSDK